MKKVFFSFHYALDNWRVNQVRNMGVVEGQRICKPNEWEEVKQKGDENIKKWINGEMGGCECVIVLIGTQTHERKWVKYEVQRAKDTEKPVFGIFIYNLKDKDGKTAQKGRNNFEIFVYEPKNYDEIKENLETWIEKRCEFFREQKLLPTQRW